MGRPIVKNVAQGKINAIKSLISSPFTDRTRPECPSEENLKKIFLITHDNKPDS